MMEIFWLVVIFLSFVGSCFFFNLFLDSLESKKELQLDANVQLCADASL